MYGVRSMAVHGEPIAEDRLFTGLQESFDLLRGLLVDAIERDRVRNEEDFLSELLS